MKTPEELAEEYLRYESESHYWAKQAFLAGYQAVAPQWISVKDRLPENESTCLIVSAKEEGICVALAIEPYWSKWEVTHWMPLPEPPKDVKD